MAIDSHITKSPPPLPERVDHAASTGILAKLNAEQKSILLSSGHLSDVAGGQVLYIAEDPPQFVGLIIEGFLRVFIAGVSSGRENTIRYVRPGDLLGVVAALSGPSATSVQTLRDSLIWLVDAAAFRRAAQNDIQIAWLMAEECANRVAALIDEIAGGAIPGSVDHPNRFGQRRRRRARGICPRTSCFARRRLNPPGSGRHRHSQPGWPAKNSG